MEACVRAVAPSMKVSLLTGSERRLISTTKGVRIALRPLWGSDPPARPAKRYGDRRRPLVVALNPPAQLGGVCLRHCVVKRMHADLQSIVRAVARRRRTATPHAAYRGRGLDRFDSVFRTIGRYFRVRRWHPAVEFLGYSWRG